MQKKSVRIALSLCADGYENTWATQWNRAKQRNNMSGLQDNELSLAYTDSELPVMHRWSCLEANCLVTLGAPLRYLGVT